MKHLDMLRYRRFGYPKYFDMRGVDFIFFCGSAKIFLDIAPDRVFKRTHGRHDDENDGPLSLVERFGGGEGCESSGKTAFCDVARMDGKVCGFQGIAAWTGELHEVLAGGGDGEASGGMANRTMGSGDPLVFEVVGESAGEGRRGARIGGPGAGCGESGRGAAGIVTQDAGDVRSLGGIIRGVDGR